MRFKKIALASCFSLLVGTIVVPVSSSVNRDTKTDSTIRMQLADGMPLPPPHKEVLLADGMPLPPPHEAVLSADGMPLPPPHGSKATANA
ncbi:MAG TPA: hypothetical protein VF863_05260 [Candidatus Acidoferrum sp.]|jgi:hypothetical protein